MKKNPLDKASDEHRRVYHKAMECLANKEQWKITKQYDRSSARFGFGWYVYRKDMLQICWEKYSFSVLVGGSELHFKRTDWLNRDLYPELSQAIEEINQMVREQKKLARNSSFEAAMSKLP